MSLAAFASGVLCWGKPSLEKEARLRQGFALCPGKVQGAARGVGPTSWLNHLLLFEQPTSCLQPDQAGRPGFETGPARSAAVPGRVSVVVSVCGVCTRGLDSGLGCGDTRARGRTALGNKAGGGGGRRGEETLKD